MSWERRPVFEVMPGTALHEAGKCNSMVISMLQLLLYVDTGIHKDSLITCVFKWRKKVHFLNEKRSDENSGQLSCGV